MVGTILLLTFPATGLTAAYKEGAVADGGSIKGKLSFKGALPKDAIDKIAITKNSVEDVDRL